MAVRLKWPILGVIIPCVLISVLGYGSHYFVFKHHVSGSSQIWFEISLTVLWISYVIAIYADPGTAPPAFSPQPGEWRRWCKKCLNYKPERAHHCKQCNKCILLMDHHCPWTLNCVGHNNMGHFMRFLFWILVNTGVVFVVLLQSGIQFYHDRNLPSYLFNKTELVAVIVLLPVDLFVFVAILILYLRCVNNWVLKGMSQIEAWELERIESQFHTERIWLQIRKNYYKLHGKPMPPLTSWNRNFAYHSSDQNNHQPDLSIVPEEFTIDDLVFPYDLGFWTNLTSIFNYPWLWLFPWTGPRSCGYRFEKNEFAEDDQLGLPWPPDGGHQEFEPDPEVDINSLSTRDLQNIHKLRRRLDPRANLDRNQWTNDLGETLDDFGVDLEAEDVENDDLLALRSTSTRNVQHDRQ